MRLLLASAVALVAVAFAAPSFAQDESPAPVPTAKPKAGTSAYCQTLKSASSRSACLKKVNVAKAQPKAAPTKTAKATTKAKKPATATSKAPDSAQLPPAAAPTASPSGTVAVPPLPSKTI
jgi:peptidoglycan hydrolase CwlO-like protein